MFPVVELVLGDVKPFTEVFQGRAAKEGLSQDPQDKEKTITKIGDDQVREDGMGMPAAGADQTKDRDAGGSGGVVDQIGESAAVISVDAAVPGGPTGRTGLKFRSERGHIGIKKIF